MKRVSILLFVLVAAVLLPGRVFSQGSDSSQPETTDRLRPAGGTGERPGPPDPKEIERARDEQIAKSLNMEYKVVEKQLKELRAIDAADLEKYKEFLHEKKTGAFQLLPNFDCVTKTGLRTDAECTGFFPGNSYYSVKSKVYSDSQNHDIGYYRDQLISFPFFTHGILVSLGDAPIEKLALTDPGLKALVDIQPAKTIVEARELSAKIAKGIETGALVYAGHVTAAENTTYALRTIEYKPDFPMPKTMQGGSKMVFRLAGLTRERRVDSIIVFRVVRKTPTGKATIIWKQLSSGDGPKLVFGKDEELTDVR